MFAAAMKKGGITAILTLMSITAYAAEMPPNSYLCHVKVAEGGDGIVFVQAYDVQDAVDGAADSTAIVESSEKMAVVRVVQCVEESQKLSNARMQLFAENLPR